MNDKLYLEVLRHNPDIDKNDVKSYLAMNEYDLLITYKNNQRELFDTFDNTRRYIPYVSEALTTEQMRKEFTIQLSKLMRRKNVTQEELAYNIGTSQSMVCKYLNGEALPGFIILKKIANALHCHVDDLYSVY